MMTTAQTARMGGCVRSLDGNVLERFDVNGCRSRCSQTGSVRCEAFVLERVRTFQQLKWKLLK